MRSPTFLHENRTYGPQNFDHRYKTTFATQSAERRPEQVQQTAAIIRSPSARRCARDTRQRARTALVIRIRVIVLTGITAGAKAASGISAYLPPPRRARPPPVCHPATGS